MITARLPPHFRLNDRNEPDSAALETRQIFDPMLDRITLMPSLNQMHGYMLEVETVEWPHPHEPHSVWIPIKSWPSPPSLETLLKKVNSIQCKRQFFITCSHCKRHVLAGHTNGSTCHGCMEKHHNVTF